MASLYDKEACPARQRFDAASKCRPFFAVTCFSFRLLGVIEGIPCTFSTEQLDQHLSLSLSLPSRCLRNPYYPPPQLIISSATLDAEKFSKFFDDAVIFIFPGHMYPVDILYTKAPEADYLDAAVVTVLQVNYKTKHDQKTIAFFYHPRARQIWGRQVGQGGGPRIRNHQSSTASHVRQQRQQRDCQRDCQQKRRETSRFLAKQARFGG